MKKIDGCCKGDSSYYHAIILNCSTLEPFKAKEGLMS